MRNQISNTKLRQPRHQFVKLSWLKVLIQLFFLINIRNVIKCNFVFDSNVFLNKVNEYEQNHLYSKGTMIEIILFYYDASKTIQYNLWINISYSIQFRRNLCEICDPLKIQLSSYTVAQCISALSLYESFVDVKHHKNLNLNKKSLNIHNMIVEKIDNAQDILITIDTDTKHRNNRVLNLYFNIINDENIYKLITNLLKFDLSKFINPIKDIFEKIFTFDKIKCNNGNCNGSLVSGKTSTISVAFGNVDGPMICNSITRKCKKCQCKYFYGKKFNNGDMIIFNVLKYKYYEASSCTYFKTDIMDELANLLCGFTVPINVFPLLYNDRFYDKIQIIKNKLKSLNCSLGVRKRYDPIITYKVLIDSFFNYFLLKTLFYHCGFNEEIIITKTEILQVVNKKKEIRTKFSKGEPSKCEIHFRDRDIFNLLYRKYHKKINSIDCQMIGMAPVINYNLLLDHFLLYGDGGRPPAQLICRTPHNQFQCFYEQNLIQPYQINEHETIIKCNQCPFKGNQHILSFHICIDCALIFYDFQLRGIEINRYIEYIELKASKERVITLLKKTNSEKSLKELNDKFDIITKFINAFCKYAIKFESIEKQITGCNINTELVLRSSARLQNKPSQNYSDINDTNIYFDYIDENDNEAQYEENNNNNISQYNDIQINQTQCLVFL